MHLSRPPDPDQPLQKPLEVEQTSELATLHVRVQELAQELEQMRQEVQDLRNEKADLEMLLEMTTEHSDTLEEELYGRVEATLRESEKRFRLITESMPIPVIISRLSDSEILYANTPVGVLVGTESEELVGRKTHEFYAHPDEEQQLFEILHIQGQVSNYEMQGKTVGGEPFWIEATVRPIELNDERCLLIALYNVTDRKQDEEERVRLTESLEAALEKQVKLTHAYSRFIPSEIIQLLGKESIIEVEMGDQIQQEMTVLFCDIRSFTTLSEQMSPQENFNFLNSYLGRVSPIIREHYGVIDKYIGDAIMAIFPRNPNDALDAAIAIQHAVALYNVHRARSDYQPISIGIGLHTGNVMLGVVGEAERMEGTVISDTVNLASRIEGLTKMYGASTVISENTLFRLKGLTRYTFRFLDKVRVKGKKDPISVFEIFDGNPHEIIKLKMATQTDFEKGLLHYHSEEFDEAQTHFEKVLAVDPGDMAAQIYLKRIYRFMQYGVPVDWEGIEALTEK